MNIQIIIVIIVFIVSGLFGISGLIHPWFLVMNEFVKEINLPSILTSNQILNWEFKGIKKYFNHRVVYENDKKMYKKNYIKCLMPHGVVPFSIMCLWGEEHEKDFFHWDKNVFVTSHQFYKFPFISHYAKRCNGIPSNYKQMEKVLLNNKSLIVYPGGIREMFSCYDDKENITILKRRGIFQMSLKTGKSLLPIYTFGITELYERSKIKITLPFFFKNDKDNISWYYGKYYTPIPIQNDLLTVVGNPIPVIKKDNVSEQDIIDLRNKYMNEVKRLYNKWSILYKKSWENRELIFD